MKNDKLIAVAMLTCALGYCSSLFLMRAVRCENQDAPPTSLNPRADSPARIPLSSSGYKVETATWSKSRKTSLLECGLSEAPIITADDSGTPVESHTVPEFRDPLDPSASLLIQEPSRRSAFRPDFTGASRNSNQRNNFFMLQAFKDAVDDCWQCTVQVYCDGDQCAYGTIVDQDGWIITKASELDSDREINCVLSDQREFKADLVSSLADLDLALLRIPIGGLTTVQWEYSVPEQGKWLATTDSSSELPAAIGVVSAGPSRIPNQRAVLGVELAPDETREKTGARIKHVLVGSGAYLAGLRQDDLISSVNGAPVQTRDELLGLLRSGKGGQFLKLLVQRGEQQLDLRVRLMDLSYELLDETELEVNGPISARATGFHRVFMHDTVIQPNQCGGPVVNLDGKAVGINIARAGRVSTYALPADTVRPAVQGLLEDAKLVSHSPRTATAEVDPSPKATDLPFATAP